MRPAALIVYSLTFVATICSAGLTVESHEPDQSTLVEASIDLLESCYAGRFSTVGLAGPAAGSIISLMALRNTVISATLIDESSGPVNDTPVRSASRHKLQVFAVTVTNSSNLVKTLVRVRNSTWWNHMASFVLIDQSGMNYGCSNAYKFLWEAWKMNLLNSKFMCVSPTRGRLIYTFNPYMAKAPVPWQQQNSYKGINGHVWTLFLREYRKDQSRCDVLDFDKTLDLGGYEICVASTNKEWWYPDSTKELTIRGQVHQVTAQILKDSLNATWKLLSRPENLKGNEMATLDHFTREVQNGNCEVHLAIVIQHSVAESITTYPLTELSVAILTQYRGNKSQLDKIISVLDSRSRFGVVVVLLITLSFFKFYLGRPLILAILDLVLITCNAAIRKIPRELAPRIYFGSLFIFVVTIQGIYQGKLATLLTGYVRLRNINSVEDLAYSDHTIYGREPFQIFFNTSAFYGRFVLLSERNCTGQVLRDSKAACIGTSIDLTREAASFKLHLSSEPIGVFRGVYFIRPDWPLEERVNAIYEKAVASGTANFLKIKALNSEIKTLESYEYQYQHQEVKVITLEKLGFAFVILAIGLGCAAIIFIIEVAIYGRVIPRLLRC